MFSVPIKISPLVGSSKPAIILKVVVFPQPDGPSKAKNDPAGMVRVKSCTAVKSSYLLVKFLRCKS